MNDDSSDTDGLVTGRPRRVLTIAAAILLIVSVIGTLYVATTEFETGETYTEFYILGENGTAAGYPTNLAPGEQGTVLVGISNHERERVTYRMLVRWNDTTTQSREVTVAADRTEEFPVTVTAPDTGGNYQLRFLLYRTPDSAEPYKSLHLYVDVR